MTLSNAILRPGTVLQVVDNIGTIKVSAPGLFSEMDDPNMLPPVSPLLLNFSNQFSTPNVDDEVWVLNFLDNPLQLYWFRKDNFEKNNEEFQNEKNLEVLCSRSSGFSWATIYFSDDSGWIIKNDQSCIQINKDGDIKLKHPAPNRCIEINSDNISLGSEGESSHPAAYADVISELLNKVYMTFSAISSSAAANPMTAHIGAAIQSIGDWSTEIPNIESQNVTLE
jgi:hypothetical protein